MEISLLPRAGAIRDSAGIIKMVADDDTEEGLGVSIVGDSTGEVIHEAAMAMRFHAKVQDYIDDCTSIRQWTKPSTSSPSHATKIPANSPAARNETAGAVTRSFRWLAKLSDFRRDPISPRRITSRSQQHARPAKKNDQCVKKSHRDRDLTDDW
jgi:hypothetical protein